VDAFGDAAGPPIRVRIRVGGTVQGVGFRPYVYGLAHRLQLAGLVGNDGRGVFIEAEGAAAAVAAFLEALQLEAPPLAVIEDVESVVIDVTGGAGFSIVASDPTGGRDVVVSADVATCPDCLREIFDPADRRYRYPFTNCTNCGPRFTIVRTVPYDRPGTTMAGFPLCADCAREYADPLDRRFHAQPVCCPACGPRLRLTDRDGGEVAGDPVRQAAALLRSGHVLAIKGLGGYHLAVLAADESAAATLRVRKHREDRPFAVMAPDLATARLLCDIGSVEAELLSGPAAPIVVLPRLADAAVARSVAPRERSLGLMLPYTPLHHLLAAELAAPFVLTSGNVSDEPIAFSDEDAMTRLTGIADYFLTHDRPIYRRVDDSVVRVVGSRPAPIRRSRGYVPSPLSLPERLRRPVLACGAELKNTFCLATGGRAFVSHHIGDLENYETLRSYTDGIEHFRRLFAIDPEVVAHDLHPEYLSTKYAVDLEGVELVGVQHHHAHLAACLADNSATGPVIGVAFDGLGFGLDGTMWGGEFLVADLLGFDRAAHLETVPLPGGAAAIRAPWRMAAAYLDRAFEGAVPEGLDVVRRNAGRWEDVVAVARSRVNTPLTSSAGRLFDAVAAIVGIRDTVNYEGQAAVELEQRAEPGEAGRYRAGVAEGWPLVIHGTDLVRAVVREVTAGVPVATVAARFHNSIVGLIVEICGLVRGRTGLSTVALSGGVFQNVWLIERAVAELTVAGFTVLTHSRVPTNDAGISLGQVAVAGARDGGTPP